MSKRLLLVSFVAATVVGLGRGQEDAAAAEAKKRLDIFVGDWEVAVWFKTPAGQEMNGKSRCQTKAVLDGMFVHQEYKSKIGNEQLTVWQFLGYDTIKKKYVESDIHLEGKRTHTIHLEGSLSGDGKVLTLVGDSIDGFTGKPVKLRAVTTVADDNQYTLDWFITDSTGREEKKVSLKHTRRK